MEGKELMMKHGLVRLPPGFRFHPTDEELVVQYLKRKAFSFPLPASIIPEIDLLNYNPWDLPTGFGGDRYFFNLREAKCEANKWRGFTQATKSGYWKAKGKEKPVLNLQSNQVVGAKQALAFYRGRPPHGEQTDWIMHEYSLCTNDHLKFLPQTLHASGKEWVVCRIFAKRRYMKLKARIRRHEENDHVPTSCSSPSSSCITDI